MVASGKDGGVHEIVGGRGFREQAKECGDKQVETKHCCREEIIANALDELEKMKQEGVDTDIPEESTAAAVARALVIGGEEERRENFRPSSVSL